MNRDPWVIGQRAFLKEHSVDRGDLKESEKSVDKGAVNNEEQKSSKAADHVEYTDFYIFTYKEIYASEEHGRMAQKPLQNIVVQKVGVVIVIDVEDNADRAADYTAPEGELREHLYDFGVLIIREGHDE